MTDGIPAGEFTGTAHVTLTVPTQHGRTEVTLHAGVIDEDARELFGRHSCHRLAAAIACLTGWDVVTILTADAEGGRPVAAHSLVRTPAGTVADISGEYPDLATVATIAARSYTPDTRFWLHVGRGEDMPGEVITGVPDRRGSPVRARIPPAASRSARAADGSSTMAASSSGPAPASRAAPSGVGTNRAGSAGSAYSWKWGEAATSSSLMLMRTPPSRGRAGGGGGRRVPWPPGRRCCRV